MKKVIIILLSLFLVGCSKNTNQEIYDQYVLETNKINESSQDVMYDINANIELFANNEYIYQVIIDNPKEDMNNLQVMVTHNQETDDIFPNIGILNETYNLLINGNDKGINLVGYIKENNYQIVTIKVLVKYDNVTNYHIFNLNIN